MMDQYFQGVSGIQESSDDSQLFSGHPKTPERKYTNNFDGDSHRQNAMTPYVVRTPPGLVRYSLPSTPEAPRSPTYPIPTTPHWVPPSPIYSLRYPPGTSIPFDCSLSSAPAPPAYSGVGDNSISEMDSDFWACPPHFTTSMETQVGVAQAPQLEFEYEEYSDDSDKVSEPDDDGYYASGEDTSCEGGSEERQDGVDDSSDWEIYEANTCSSFAKEDGYYASSEGSSSVEGSPAASTTSGCYSLEPLLHFGFIRKPLSSQGREYEQWLESQDEPSGRSDNPEIRSPIPRRLVHLRDFPL